MRLGDAVWPPSPRPMPSARVALIGSSFAMVCVGRGVGGREETPLGLGQMERAMMQGRASTGGDLQALPLLAARHIHIVALPPRLTHAIQPVEVYGERAFVSTCVGSEGMEGSGWPIPDSLDADTGRLP
jgi:hypothetical protein